MALGDAGYPATFATLPVVWAEKRYIKKDSTVYKLVDDMDYYLWWMINADYIMVFDRCGLFIDNLLVIDSGWWMWIIYDYLINVDDCLFD